MRQPVTETERVMTSLLSDVTGGKPQGPQSRRQKCVCSPISSVIGADSALRIDAIIFFKSADVAVYVERHGCTLRSLHDFSLRVSWSIRR